MLSEQEAVRLIELRAKMGGYFTRLNREEKAEYKDLIAKERNTPVVVEAEEIVDEPIQAEPIPVEVQTIVLPEPPVSYSESNLEKLQAAWGEFPDADDKGRVTPLFSDVNFLAQDPDAVFQSVFNLVKDGSCRASLRKYFGKQ